MNTIRHVPYVFDLPNSFARAPNKWTDCMILSLLKQRRECEPLCCHTKRSNFVYQNSLKHTLSARKSYMVFVRLRFGSTVRERCVYFGDEIIIDWLFVCVSVCVLTQTAQKSHIIRQTERPEIEILWISNRSINKYKQKKNTRGPEKKNISRKQTSFHFISNLHMQTYTDSHSHAQILIWQNTAIYDFDCGGFMSFFTRLWVPNPRL